MLPHPQMTMHTLAKFEKSYCMKTQAFADNSNPMIFWITCRVNRVIIFRDSDELLGHLRGPKALRQHKVSGVTPLTPRLPLANRLWSAALHHETDVNESPDPCKIQPRTCMHMGSYIGVDHLFVAFIVSTLVRPHNSISNKLFNTFSLPYSPARC